MRRIILKDVKIKQAEPEGGIDLPCIHTRNGDSVEVHFDQPGKRGARIDFGFAGGMEHATVSLDFGRRRAILRTSEWTKRQPILECRFKLRRRSTHVLRIEKTEGSGRLVKMADLAVLLDGDEILRAPEVDILPEIDVSLRSEGVGINRFVHRGAPSGIPDRLRLGGWQMLNVPSIEDNFASLKRGIARAAEDGVELLVTTETSLTGLFPSKRVTQDVDPVARAERKLRRWIRGAQDAPHVVVGLPHWEGRPVRGRKRTRYNVSRVYDPDGQVLFTGAKIHSCEPEFWHGYRLQEFDVNGVPICMHICHDGRYPEVWTLPVMFGSRLVLHPANGGTITGSIDAFERGANQSTWSSHAFYMHVNGGGGSYIAGPQKFDNVLAVSAECRRDAPSFPAVGAPEECLFTADIAVDEAFGYWPARSFRASEQAAEAYVHLYRARGGIRLGEGQVSQD